MNQKINLKHNATNEHYELTIFQDEHAESPRNDENLGTLYAWHKRYNLADNDVKHLDIETVQKFYESSNTIGFKVYMYEHSNIALSTSPFSCRWDSGQVGFILVHKDKARQWFNKKRLSKALIKRIEDQLRSEIETYSKYLNGEVYGFELGDSTGETIDICHDYYDSPENIIEQIKKERNLSNV